MEIAGFMPSSISALSLRRKARYKTFLLRDDESQRHDARSFCEFLGRLLFSRARVDEAHSSSRLLPISRAGSPRVAPARSPTRILFWSVLRPAATSRDVSPSGDFLPLGFLNGAKSVRYVSVCADRLSIWSRFSQSSHTCRIIKYVTRCQLPGKSTILRDFFRT